MVHDDSHRTLRASADSISRRAGSIGMTALPGTVNGRDFSASICVKNLKFSRHTPEYWDKFPLSSPSSRVYPNADARRHRPQDPQPAAIRQPYHHAGTRRQGRPVGLALPPPGETSGGARRDHALYRHRRPEIAGVARQRVHLDHARAAEGGGPQPVREGDLEMGRGAGVLSDDRKPRLSAAVSYTHLTL